VGQGPAFEGSKPSAPLSRISLTVAEGEVKELVFNLSPEAKITGNVHRVCQER